MTKNTATLEIWALVDEHGNYVVSPYRRALHDQWHDEIGVAPLNTRTVRLTAVVELPRGAEASALGVIALPAPADSKAPTHVTMEA
jgi:hypothetical protein